MDGKPMSNLRSSLRTVCLRGALVAAGRGERPYFRVDPHLTASGHRRVADALYPFIARQTAGAGAGAAAAALTR